MQLEDYFDFVERDDIRIRGSRVGIESVLHEYVYSGRTAEEIAQLFPTLTLEQVHAAILYYLHDQPAMGRYLDEWMEHCRRAEQEFDRNPPVVVRKLRRLRAGQENKEAAA